MSYTTADQLNEDQLAHLRHRLLAMLDRESRPQDDPDGDGRPPPSQRDLLELEEAIRNALAKIENGSYGTCEQCRVPLPFERLDAVPHARYCVPCQQRPRNLFG